MNHGDIDWSRALCRSAAYASSDIWFDEDTEQIAVELCKTRCPLTVLCAQYALEKKEKFGVWGGTTAQQRKVINWPKNRVKCPGCRSGDVTSLDSKTETCWSCGLSWKV